MKCGFCSAIATGVCAVSTTEPRIHMPLELESGDTVQVFWDLQFYVIDKIQEGIVTVWVKRKRKRTFELTSTLPVLVMESIACGIPVCEVHGVDRGAGLVCCRHWEVKAVEPDPIPEVIRKRIVTPAFLPVRAVEPRRGLAKKSQS